MGRRFCARTLLLPGGGFLLPTPEVVPIHMNRTTPEPSSGLMPLATSYGSTVATDQQLVEIGVFCARIDVPCHQLRAEPMLATKGDGSARQR